MLFATFTLALNNVLLWLCPVGARDGVLIAWLLGFLLLQETFNTFFATPYAALCIDIAPDYNDQTKMQGFKTVFYILGLILPSVLMYAFMPAGSGQFNRMGYVCIACVNSALVILCGLITIFGTRKRVRSMPNYDVAIGEGLGQTAESKKDFIASVSSNYGVKKLSTGTAQTFGQNSKNREKHGFFAKKLKVLSKKHSKNVEMAEHERRKNNSAKNGVTKGEKKKNRGKFGGSFGKIMAGYVDTFKKPNFRVVMVGYSVCLIASVFITSVGMHLFTFCFNFSSVQISSLMICFFGGAILSQVLWVNVVKKYDKKQALIFALCVMLFGIAMTSITFLFRLYSTPNCIFWFVLPCLFVCGVGSGALYSLPHSMYADVITMEQYQTGENNSGRYTGYYTFTYNFSNSIALLFIGVLLDLVKFDGNAATQSLEVQSGLAKIVFFGSAIALTIAILVFSKYSIKRSDVLKVQISANEKGGKKT